jgi:hypothetical protein
MERIWEVIQRISKLIAPKRQVLVKKEINIAQKASLVR